MAVRDLIPWGRNQSSVPTNMQGGSELDPFLTLHREMNRVFEDMFRRFDTGLPSASTAQGWPSLEVNTTDKEVRVSAELPGLDEKDVEVLVDDGVLTIRGEKKSETDDKDRGFSERYYGRFERRIPLAWDVEEDKIDAAFRNGVLTVTMPKSAQASSHVKRIAINRGEATKH